MRLLDKFRKPRVSCQQAGEMLFSVALKCAMDFEKNDLPKIMDDLGLNKESYDKAMIRSTLYGAAFWLLSKALENDKPEVVHGAQEAFLKLFYPEHQSVAITAIKQRRLKYNEAWDYNTGGEKYELALDFLGDLFNNGKHDKEFFDAVVIAKIIVFLFCTQQLVLEMRKIIKLSD